MLDEADMRFAIDDARVRHKSLIDLINGTSDQALRLLGFYITLSLAAASTGVAGLSGTTAIPVAVTVGLLFTGLPLLMGSLFCFWTIKPSAISLPGRDPEFWLWAARSDITREASFAAYLENLKEKIADNRKLNDETSTMLARAKMCGLLTPAIALVSGGATLLLRHCAIWS